MNVYLKAVVHLLVVVLAALVPLLSSGNNHLSAKEWINVAILGAGSIGVFFAPNVPGAKYTKAILAAVTAVLTLLVTFIGHGAVNTGQIIQLILAGLGALGVLSFANTPATKV